MSLSRVWMTKLTAASLAALLAPGAMLGALALLVIAGGFGGIGSLGQAFSGPALPAGQPLPARAAPRTVVASDRRTAAAASAPAAARGGVAQPSLRGQSLRPPSGSSPGRPVSASIGSPATATAPAASRRATRPQSVPSSAPSPPPNPARAIVDEIVNEGKSVSQGLPEPAGAAVSQGLQAVGSTADQVLAGPAPGPPGTSAR